MSYRGIEATAADGNPVYRFLFVQGDTTYAYTTEPNIVADSSYTFQPAQIRASEVSQTNEMAKDPLKLQFPRDNEFAALFLGGVPEQITTVTVLRGHLTDADMEFQFYWKGRVAGASASVDTVTIECENVFTSMRRPGLRARYQRKCRHALYQTGCGLTDSDFAIEADVIATAGNTVTVSTLSTSNVDSDVADADEFVGGVLETGEGFRRYIIGQSGNVLTLIRALPTLSEDLTDSVGGAVVTLYPGCDHTRATCKDKFNNLANFGGFPWLPGKNPFRNKIEGGIN